MVTRNAGDDDERDSGRGKVTAARLSFLNRKGKTSCLMGKLRQIIKHVSFRFLHTSISAPTVCHRQLMHQTSQRCLAGLGA